MDRNKLIEQITQVVEARLGGGKAELGSVIAEEVAAVFAQEAAGPLDDPRAVSRVVVTAHGLNRTGVVARLAVAIDEFRGDIRDLSQTIVGDYFTMLFVVDVPDTPGDAGGTHFTQLRQRLKEVAEDLGVHVVVMHDDILSAMHTI